MQTVSDRIFELLREKNISQKEFARQTGIAESTISDWKKKRTNPVSDKILAICDALDVTPEYLLSGADHTGTRSRETDYYVIDRKSDIGFLIETYQGLDLSAQKRLQGYMDALVEIRKTEEQIDQSL